MICVAVTASGGRRGCVLGHPAFGPFFGIGMALGCSTPCWSGGGHLDHRADHPLKKKMALNSATWLLAITVVGLAIAFYFKPMGLGVLFGLALFQVILVLSTSLPVMKKLREGAAAEADEAPVSNDG